MKHHFSVDWNRTGGPGELLANGLQGYATNRDQLGGMTTFWCFLRNGSTWRIESVMNDVRDWDEVAREGLVIARVEGGIWHAPGFESRLDCIWDGQAPPLDPDQASANNKEAARFIASQAPAHGAFILTAPPLAGWPHRAGQQSG